MTFDRNRGSENENVEGLRWKPTQHNRSTHHFKAFRASIIACLPSRIKTTILSTSILFWASTNLLSRVNAFSTLAPTVCGLVVTTDLASDSSLDSSNRYCSTSGTSGLIDNGRLTWVVSLTSLAPALRHDASEGSTSVSSPIVDAKEFFAASTDGNSLRKAFDGHGSNSPTYDRKYLSRASRLFPALAQASTTDRKREA